MTAPILFTLFAASLLAMGFAYSALPSQRWWRRPIRRGPAQVTAVLAALVALRGWIEVLGVVHGGLAWFSTLAVPLVVLFLAAERKDAALDEADLTEGMTAFRTDVFAR